MKTTIEKKLLTRITLTQEEREQKSLMLDLKKDAAFEAQRKAEEEALVEADRKEKELIKKEATARCEINKKNREAENEEIEQTRLKKKEVISYINGFINFEDGTSIKFVKRIPTAPKSSPYIEVGDSVIYNTNAKVCDEKGIIVIKK